MKTPESAAQIEERVHPFRVFTQYEKMVSLACFLIALATYWYTAMPNIGLNDDGEMVTAALHFGVMHPSAYPLWTILADLFSHLFPFGNGSWKVALFSGLCTAVGVGVFSLVSLNASCWLGVKKIPATILSVAFTLTAAWVNPVWSHAVVDKGLYALHVCLMMILLAICYVWIRRPHWKNAFVWVVFVFCLGMSNHHTTLALAALPLLVILLLHAELFWEYFVYSALIASALYLGFGSLAPPDIQPAIMKAAVRLFYTVWVGFILLVVIQRKLTEWRQGLLLVVAVVVGLSPYYYLRVASNTNPPMNWSYCSSNEGFFYAINRSQYWGTLADQLQGTVGKLMGVPPAEKQKGPKAPDEETALQSFAGFCEVYWKVMLKNVSPIPIILVFLGFVLFWRLPREQRIWLYLLVIAFCLSAFLQALSWNNGYDNPGWDMQYQYVSLGYVFFIMLASFGGAIAFARLEKAVPLARWGVLGLVVATTIYTFIVSLPVSSQRGHWFGWMFGHDMLVDLPKDSFVFGGTDPGRFVPTYMVFGESFEKTKRDPNFDRRDLYIVTQNALADTFYNRYIRSHYTTERPTDYNWFELLLGRDHTYPKEYLTLPHREDIMGLFSDLMRKFQESGGSMPNPQSDPVALNSAVAEWIFLHNRDKADGTPRHFYVEESFPMQWSYPYAVPHGLCYEILHDPIPALPPGAAAKDLAWWDDYIQNHLEKTAGFKYDDLAQHSFAKLRNTGGNIYAFRNMRPEAERAYRQALYLWPANTETTGNLANLLWSEGRFQDAYDLLAESLPIDPNSKPLKRMKTLAEARLQASKNIAPAIMALQADPNNRQKLAPVIQNLLILGKQQEIDMIVSNAIAATPNDVPFLQDMINLYATQGRIPRALEIALALQKVQPNRWDVPYTIAKYQLLTGHREECYNSLHQAVQMGGNAALQQIGREGVFQQVMQDPAFQAAVQVTQPLNSITAPATQGTSNGIGPVR